MQDLPAIFHKSRSMSRSDSPPHQSDWGKTYFLFVPEVHRLANLYTPVSLRFRQDLQAIFHRSPSIRKFVHLRISQTQARLTSYSSQESTHQLANLSTPAKLWSKQGLHPIFHENPSVKNPYTPSWFRFKAYTLFFVEVRQLANLVHPHITQIEARHTSCLSQKSIN